VCVITTLFICTWSLVLLQFYFVLTFGIINTFSQTFIFFKKSKYNYAPLFIYTPTKFRIYLLIY
jgi:hypothetical protein